LRAYVQLDVAGYEWVDLGEVSIQNQPADTVHTASWSLEPAAGGLEQTYTQLTLCFAIGGVAGGYRLDNISIEGAGSTTTDGSGGTSSGGTGGAGGSGGAAGTGGDYSDPAECIPESDSWDRLVLKFPRNLSMQ